MLFIAFRVPYSPAIGVKLISTPWTDQNLDHAEGICAEQLRQEHRNQGMPADLANILELAGQADVRLLILDSASPPLLCLPLSDSYQSRHAPFFLFVLPPFCPSPTRRWSLPFS